MGWTELGPARVGVLPRVRSLPAVARARVPADLWGEPTAVGRDAVEAIDTWARGLVGGAVLPVGAQDDGRWQTDHTPEVLRWRYELASLAYRAVPTAGDPEVGLALFRLRRRGPALEAVVTDVLGPAGGAAGTSGRPATRPATDPPRDRRRPPARDHRRAGRFDAVGRGAGARPDGHGPSLATRSPSSLADIHFSLGDLELF